VAKIDLPIDFVTYQQIFAVGNSNFSCSESFSSQNISRSRGRFQNSCKIESTL